MNIGIIGLGYVGLTLAMAAANSGHIVYGTEINEHIKKCITKKKAHFYEPGIDNLIRRHLDRSFFVVDEFSPDIPIEAFIITVGTPLSGEEVDGVKQPNFDYIRSAIKSIKVYDGTQMIILRSTVSVGTTRNVVIPYLCELSGKKESEILVGMCPERTLEGKAVHELTHLPQIISGNNPESIDIAQRLFRNITPYVITADSIEEAELAKLYCNTYRDMTFALGNAFCMAAQEFGVDGISVIKHANQGYDRSNIAYPGYVAGPCLEKDAYILINNMPECDSKKFILSARKFNESLIDITVNWVRERIGEPEKGKRITLSGMAFKGNPETSDLRGSSSVYIANALIKAGYELNIHDYVAIKDEMEALHVGAVYDDLYEACKDSQLLLVLNNNSRYGKLLYNEVFSKTKRGFAVLDTWKACTELYYADDIDIRTLGNMNID
ncbi:nucleotide sugar dehydrogenase [Butyrivibrio sp. VCB2001]|uniref:nucleotide sugar dehydrogenase n=1 Tax=Butyrivibrio sp. VCB2001 TaxID=1280667 RepID=UPI00040F4B1F|nr:nucleotide sugar dehydrogenase [Butyrivibrio sp. VCB2001]